MQPTSNPTESVVLSGTDKHTRFDSKPHSVVASSLLNVPAPKRTASLA